jgi:hypothetical protein
MMVNGSTERRSRFSSWCRGDSDRVSRELRVRQMYNPATGKAYNSSNHTMPHSRKEVCDRTQERMSEVIKSSVEHSEPKKTSQSTMCLFGSCSPSTKSGNGFFNKILREVDAESSKKKKSSKSWMKGMGNVPQEKKASIERTLKWMEEKLEDKSEEPDIPMLFGGNGIQEGNGKIQSPEIPASDENMVSALRSDVFISIRSRIGNLLLQDLSEPVTAELRQMGKELEQLSQTLNSP